LSFFSYDRFSSSHEQFYYTGDDLQCVHPRIPELWRTKQDLKRRVKALQGLPDNPLDVLIDQFGGPTRVAEPVREDLTCGCACVSCNLLR
jgi:hypothetical protein